MSCSTLAGQSSTYTDPSGNTFTLACARDLLGVGDIGSAAVSSYGACFSLCSSFTGCQAFTYASGSCYFKSLKGVSSQPSVSNGVDLAYIASYYTGTASSSTVSSTTSSSTASRTASTTSTSVATTTSTSTSTSTSVASTTSSTTTTATPAAATLVASCAQLGSSFQDSNNVNYNVYCAHDLLGVGDIGNKAVSSFAACFAACDTTSGCQGIAYVGGSGSGTCYFKNLKGVTAAPNANSGVDIAWLPSAYSYTPSASTSSTTGTATVTGTSTKTSTASATKT